MLKALQVADQLELLAQSVVKALPEPKAQLELLARRVFREHQQQLAAQAQLAIKVTMEQQEQRAQAQRAQLGCLEIRAQLEPLGLVEQQALPVQEQQAQQE